MKRLPFSIYHLKFKLLLVASLLFAIWSLLFITPTHAIGLKVAPLLYEEKLADGEKKKGFVDISNPNDQESAIMAEVQAFRQVNDSGDLEFYNKEEYKEGIKLDYEQFTLKSREAIRLYFLLDADKLPKGGVYVTLLFRTTTGGANPDNTSIQPATRVGTHLIIENGGGGTKTAFIKDLKASFFQWGDAVTATAAVGNPGGPKSLAFFPEFTGKVQPFGSTTTGKGPLVFPGVTRSVPIKLKGNHFGLVRVSVKTGDRENYAWVFAATGSGRWLGPLITGLLLGVAVGVYKFRRQIKAILKHVKAKGN